MQGGNPGQGRVFARVASRCSSTVESRPPEKPIRQVWALRQGERASSNLEGRSISG
ncbi:hypothetical protein QNM99_01610 [Pseudomonas sp. PCH446]